MEKIQVFYSLCFLLFITTFFFLIDSEYPELIPSKSLPVVPFRSEVSGIVRHILLFSYLYYIGSPKEKSEKVFVHNVSSVACSPVSSPIESGSTTSFISATSNTIASSSSLMKLPSLKPQDNIRNPKYVAPTPSSPENFPPSVLSSKFAAASASAGEGGRLQKLQSKAGYGSLLNLEEEEKYEGVPSKIVFIQSLNDKTPQGRLKDFHRAGITIEGEEGGIVNESPHHNSVISFHHFPPGAVCVFATDVPTVTREALKRLQPLVHSDVSKTEKGQSTLLPKSMTSASLTPLKGMLSSPSLTQFYGNSQLSRITPLLRTVSTAVLNEQIADSIISFIPTGLYDPVILRKPATDKGKLYNWSHPADGCFKADELVPCFSPLSLLDLQWLFFSSEEEEKDSVMKTKRGVYHLGNYGNLNYCGIGGVAPLLDKVSIDQDLGHPVLENLRQGNWLIDYILSRLSEKVNGSTLKKNKNASVSPFKNLFDLLVDKFSIIKTSLPRALIPRYADEVIRPLFRIGVDYALQIRMNFSAVGRTDLLHNTLCVCHSSFVRKLLLTSLEVVGLAQRTPLLDSSVLFDSPTFTLSYLTANNLVDQILNVNKKEVFESDKRNITLYSTLPPSISPSMAAGLPHFSYGFMRNWGRDTFIAFRGLLLVPRRFTEAAYIIRSYGSVMRNGLIPNLMGGGENPRYNARDATWWWAQAIQEFCAFILILSNKGSEKKNRYSSEGCNPVFPIIRKNGWKNKNVGIVDDVDDSFFPIYSADEIELPNFDAVKYFLSSPFTRKFDGTVLPSLPSEDDDEAIISTDSFHVNNSKQPYYNLSDLIFGYSRGGDSVTLLSLLHETLQSHAQGIHFREKDAGPKIDSKMKDPGFNVDISFDYETGFTFGGNSNNCGTWMDKMGDSTLAGNIGVPATPRDGFPIEIAGLLKSTIRFMRSLYNLSISPYEGVIAADYYQTVRNAKPVGTSSSSLPQSSETSGTHLSPHKLISLSSLPQLQPLSGLSLSQLRIQTRKHSILDKRDYAQMENLDPDWIPLSFEEWDVKIKKSFDRYFYIPTEQESEKYASLSISSSTNASSSHISTTIIPQHEVNYSDVFRRGIYKDVLGSSTQSWDYQLRPNQCVAMVVAPELFADGDDEEDSQFVPSSNLVSLNRDQVISRITRNLVSNSHVHNALDTITEILKTKNSLGIATLDPEDWLYRPTYDQFDTRDYNTSCGFSYHRGFIINLIFLSVCLRSRMGLDCRIFSSCFNYSLTHSKVYCIPFFSF
jgi:glycogen debranching enzyme